MAGEPCEVWFYHLERSDLGQVLPDLLEKTLARGWRALVWSPQRERLAQLDERLWTYRDDSFLPHGLAGGPMDGAQPVLLAQDCAAANGAQVLFAIDGDPGPLADWTRAVVIFDGRADEDLRRARGLWSVYKAAGHPVVYWRQSAQGAWAKQA